MIVPIAAAATSPLVQWRGPVYIAACFAGIVALGLVFVQPLLAGGYLPGLRARRGRRLHAGTGVALLAAVALHVAGLWITSPPDMIDALLLASPAPFSIWGVIALWALFAAALLAIWHRAAVRLPRYWRLAHTSAAAIAVLGSVVHALLVDGMMEAVSKAALGALALGATVRVARDLRSWAVLRWKRP